MSFLLTQRLSQRLSLQQQIQQIELSNLLKVPDEVLNLVTGAISFNPDTIEAVLKDNKSKKEGQIIGTDNKIQTVYGHLAPSKGESNEETRSGMIISPDLRLLEGKLGQARTGITPDVTYIARKGNKPELVLSDHLRGTAMTLRLEIDPAQYPETARLLAQLNKFDDWKRGTLREAYVLIGGKQREYMEDFEPTRLNIFNHENLAEKLELSPSTVYRVLDNRWAEMRNLEGEPKVVYAKDLLVTTDDLKRFIAIKQMNSMLKDEFEQGVAFSDMEIAAQIPGIARRTIAKYRQMYGIPDHRARVDAYKKSGLETPYNIRS